jgi:hypothetical protein
MEVFTKDTLISESYPGSIIKTSEIWNKAFKNITTEEIYEIINNDDKTLDTCCDKTIWEDLWMKGELNG